MFAKPFLVGILFFACISFLNAQPPGYLGKRWTVALNNYIAPSVFDEKSLMNWQTGISMAKVVSRNFSVGMGAYLYATSSELAIPNPSFDRSSISGWNLNVHAKHYNLFKKGNLAPIGPYQKIEIAYWQYTFQDRFEPYQYSVRNSNLSLGIGIGSQRVIYHFITFNYGIQANFLLPFFLSQKTLLGGQAEHLRAYNRMRDFSALSANVGLGFLLF
ncbi:MAG: hypothetical protein ACKVTZ_14840 [Bacteroidia bacterium]